MFVRIVKLSIQPEKTTDFLATFEKYQHLIRGSEGCTFLELYRDKNNTDLFFTYSYWEEEQNLENYRNSDLFKGIWKTLKTYFNGKPEAWSVDKITSLI